MLSKLKYPFWYIFKAPQRKLSKGTFKRDLQGVLRYSFRLFLKNTPEPISICVGISNRTEQFLQFVLPSIIALEQKTDVELSVYDMGSTDFDLLSESIKNQWKGKLIINHTDEKFSRAKAFNKAVIQSTGDIIFLCDADMSLPVDLIKHIRKIVKPGIAWFPICYALPPPNTSKKGKWLWYSAKGILACYKTDFEKVEMLDEQFVSWGGEDIDLWERFHKNNFVVIRQKLRGLIHHYHPPVEGAADYFA
ncbi:MAG: glycosyltransferase [Bacteroidetes bacterium]|nr:glycosyltransferase [Bacteroidota bacterium]